MDMRVMGDLISVREAAKESGRGIETVRRWIWSGKLPAQKFGNPLFVKRNDLQDFCRNHQVTKDKPSE